MAFFELNDVFGYQDANDIKKFWADVTAPASPGTGEFWLDTSVTPVQLKRYNGTDWDIIGGGITITATGDVGIGTTTPSFPVHVLRDGINASIYLERLNAATAIVSGANSGVNIGAQTDHEVRFIQDGATKMILKTDGKVGIGTTTPTYSVEVERTGENAQYAATYTGGPTTMLSSTATAGFVGTMTNHQIRLMVNNSTKMTVDTNGKVGIGTTAPATELDVVGDAQVSGTLTASEQLVIPTNQPTSLQDGSIWIA